MAEAKSYSVVEEAQQTVKDLCERYPEILWAVKPSEVVVLGVDDQARPKSCRALAKIRRITGSTKALLEYNRILVKFVIDLYWLDWKVWNQQKRQWIIFHELVHIPGPDEGGLIHHDEEDFVGVLDVAGLDWTRPDAALPDMLTGVPVQFKKVFFERLHTVEKGEDKQESVESTY